ncbi:MAG: NAD(P)/FAD-dependent oxidoreductase [bacterium]|nr:NAD(P)/FAD-dependent oxidoreductase [bacterium]
MTFSHVNIVKPILVIGGGPAGMLAAGTAAKFGAKVILLERNSRLGLKLGLTGHGRCNLTRDERAMSSFILGYGKTGKFLYSAITAFSNWDTIRFFESLGVKTKTEPDGRVFPKSDNAAEVVQALHRYLIENHVQIVYNSRVTKVIKQSNKVIGVTTVDHRFYPASAVILCTGGKSYTATGSTGDGFTIAQQLNIQVNPLRPALVPVETAEPWIQQLKGISLNNIRLTTQTNPKKLQVQGDIIFTHFGLSGPIILDNSELLGSLLHQGLVSLNLDLCPGETVSSLDNRFRSLFLEHPKQQIQTALSALLPQRIIAVILERAKVPPVKSVSQITKPDRINIIKYIKQFPITITRLRPLEEAMVTAGGIAIEEINSKTMESKRINGLYFAGEIIDVTGKSGGYNLQMAFSTGYLAGKSAATKQC